MVIVEQEKVSIFLLIPIRHHPQYLQSPLPALQELVMRRRSKCYQPQRAQVQLHQILDQTLLEKSRR